MGKDFVRDIKEFRKDFDHATGVGYGGGGGGRTSALGTPHGELYKDFVNHSKELGKDFDYAPRGRELGPNSHPWRIRQEACPRPRGRGAKVQP